MPRFLKECFCCEVLFKTRYMYVENRNIHLDDFSGGGETRPVVLYTPTVSATFMHIQSPQLHIFTHPFNGHVYYFFPIFIKTCLHFEFSPQTLVYLPQMCSMKTDAMNSRLITSTGTGPLKYTREKLAKLLLILLNHRWNFSLYKQSWQTSTSIMKTLGESEKWRLKATIQLFPK